MHASDSIDTLFNYGGASQALDHSSTYRNPRRTPQQAVKSRNVAGGKDSLKSVSLLQRYIGSLNLNSKSNSIDTSIRCAKDIDDAAINRVDSYSESVVDTSRVGAVEEEEEEGKLTPAKIYEKALGRIQDSETQRVLKHLFQEWQRQLEKQSLHLDYITHLHNSVLADLPAPGKLLKSKRQAASYESELFAIGLNDDNQLGLGVSCLNLPFTSKFRKVDADDHIVAKDQQPSSGRIQIAHVVCGSLHSVALSTAGDVYTWGLEDCIGREKKEEEEEDLWASKPLKVCFPSAKSKFQAIAAGEYITACLSLNGSVYTFGGFRNSKGERLGYHKLPRRVEFPNFTRIRQVAASECLLAALDETGTLFTWGNNEFGEGGRPPFLSLDPLRVFFPSPLSKIWAFGFSLFFKCRETMLEEDKDGANAKKNDQIYAMGKNGFGELGLGHLHSSFHPVCLDVAADVAQVAGGIHHSLLLTTDGLVFGAGKNIDGQLGLGPNVEHTPMFVPIPLPDTFVYPAVAIAAGTSSHHSCKQLFLCLKDLLTFICRYHRFHSQSLHCWSKRVWPVRSFCRKCIQV